MDPRETHKRDENYWKTRMGLPADEGNVGAGASAPAPAPEPAPEPEPEPTPEPEANVGIGTVDGNVGAGSS